MVIRFGIVAFLFFLLLALTLRSLVKGDYGRRFRIVASCLVLVLLVLTGIGIYSSFRQEGVTTPQAEFAASRQTILNTIRHHIEAGEYQEVAELADRFSQVQDPELERLLRRGRELQLLERAGSLEDDPHAMVRIYRELAAINPNPEYREKLTEWKDRLIREREREVLTIIRDLPSDKVGWRMLGYRMLAALNPDNTTYALKFRELQERLDQRLDASGWISICSASDVRYCRHVGYEARVILPPEAARGPVGEVLGVVWRPRGTIIDEQGHTAPEDSYYYILFIDGKTVLEPVNQVEVRGFPVEPPSADLQREISPGLPGSDVQR